MNNSAEGPTKYETRETVEITEVLDSFGISCSPTQAFLLWSYMKKVLEWNEKVNLTAIKDEKEFMVKHYADSLVLINEPIYSEATKIIDVGTGGGFPGVPLAIMNPEKEFVLLDSLDKRLKIIDNICEVIGKEDSASKVSNVSTLHQRAEDAGQNPAYRETFDLCVSRAVADLSVLSEYCLPFVKPGGYFVAYKSRNIDEELLNAKKAINSLGGSTQDMIIRETPTGQTLLFIKKIKSTPSKYPRRPGEPRRKPL